MAGSTSQEKEASQAENVAVNQQTSQETAVASEAVATRFLGQWNRLVSTTNWEKGSIICDWREALIESGAAVTDYSDEAWAQLVGHVTSQHVGRLRRVHQRFGSDCSQYPGLFWSHFQAAIDWDDAEMWLEGAIQNQWSVSQMRGRRWETLETPLAEQRSEVALEASEMDEESSSEEAAPAEAVDSETAAAVSPSTTTIQSADSEPSTASNKTTEEEGVSAGSEQTTQVNKRTRLKVDVENLPDDLAEAFESFKLAIIAHRREGWSATTPEVVVECLEGLRELTMAEE